jgi:hypothetical protein
MTLVVLFAIIYTAACRRELRDLKTRFQAEREVDAKSQDVVRETNSKHQEVVASLFRKLNSDIENGRQNNQNTVEAFSTQLTSRMDSERQNTQDAVEALNSDFHRQMAIERQTNQKAIGALTSDTESTKVDMQAKMELAQADIAKLKKADLQAKLGTAQAEIMKLSKAKDELIKEVSSIKAKRKDDEKKADELQITFEQRFEALEARVEKSEGDTKTTQSKLRTANDQIESLERSLDVAVREKDELATKVEGRNEVVKAQRKELDEFKAELRKAKKTISGHEDRLLVVEGDAMKVIGNLERLENEVKRDLPDLKSASAKHTRDIKIADTNLAALWKSVKDEITTALDDAKKGLETLTATVKDSVTPTLDGVKKSIEHLQKHNEDRDLKQNQLPGSINALKKTVQDNQASFIKAKIDLQASIDDVVEDIELARESSRKAIQSTADDLENLVDRGVVLRQDINDVKQKIGAAKKDIENLQKKPIVTIEEVDTLASQVRELASRTEEEVTQLRAGVNTHDKKQATTDKRLQEHGNRIDGHSRQLCDIHLTLKTFNASGVVAIPTDKSRSARQQERNATKEAEKEASEVGDAQNVLETSRFRMNKLVVLLSTMQKLGDCHVARLQQLQVATTLRLAVFMELPNSRMALLSLTSKAGLPDCFLPVLLESFTYNHQQAQLVTRRSPVVPLGEDKVPLPAASDLPSGESPQVHVVARLECGIASPGSQVSDKERVGKTSCSSPALQILQEGSCCNTRPALEVGEGDRKTIAGDDGETKVKKSQARRRKDRMWGRLAFLHAQGQTAAVTSTSTSSVLSDSTPNESTDQSVTSSNGSDPPSGSNSNESAEKYTNSAHQSQRGNPSPREETSRARRFRTYRESLMTGDGFMGRDGQWHPNNPSKGRGGGGGGGPAGHRGNGRGELRGGSFRGNHSQLFHQRTPFHKQQQQTFRQQETFHQQQPFPLQGPFLPQAPSQFNMVWDACLGRWVQGLGSSRWA